MAQYHFPLISDPRLQAFDKGKKEDVGGGGALV